MDINGSMAYSLVSRSTTSLPNSTLNEEELKQNTELILTLIKVMKSRNAVVISATEVMREHNTTRSYVNETVFDVTSVNRNCKIKLDRLWTTVENLQLKSIGLKLLAFSAVTDELISKQNQRRNRHQPQLSLSGVNELAESISVPARKFAAILQEQKTVSDVWQKELESSLNKQCQVIELVANVSEEIPTQGHKKRNDKREKELVLKTKIARAAINCLLSQRGIDFEAHPELLDLKNKWRAPLDRV